MIFFGQTRVVFAVMNCLFNMSGTRLVVSTYSNRVASHFVAQPVAQVRMHEPFRCECRRVIGSIFSWGGPASTTCRRASQQTYIKQTLFKSHRFDCCKALLTSIRHANMVSRDYGLQI